MFSLTQGIEGVWGWFFSVFGSAHFVIEPTDRRRRRNNLAQQGHKSEQTAPISRSNT